jgi:hypothetical protein
MGDSPSVFLSHPTLSIPAKAILKEPLTLCLGGMRSNSSTYPSRALAYLGSKLAGFEASGNYFDPSSP